jgi:hypothetical protein
MKAPWQPIPTGPEWPNARKLYLLYSALARECVIDLPAGGDLEAGIEDPSEASLLAGRAWLCEMDDRIQVHQLRQFLQTSVLAGEDALLRLLVHHLSKSGRSSVDRDKVDFLLVQYFSLAAPSGLDDASLDAHCVAGVLAPALGSFDAKTPDRLEPLNGLIQRAKQCSNLNQLFTSRILEEGKKLKVSSADAYFEPATMVAFTRFSFLMRRVFFRLMHRDLTAILDGLRELELSGMSVLDCRKAQFSSEEPIARLRMICQSWKVMFQAEYSSGQPLSILVDLRTVVENALARTSEKTPRAGESEKLASPQARAASAGAPGDSAGSDFEVSPDSANWDPDAGQ